MWGWAAPAPPRAAHPAAGRDAVPHIAAIGDSLTGGYGGAGAVLCPPDLAERTRISAEGTGRPTPLSAAIARTLLAVLRHGQLPRTASAKGDYLRFRIADGQGGRVSVEGCGLDVTLRPAIDHGAGRGVSVDRVLVAAARRHGLLVRPAQGGARLSPPLTCNRGQLDAIADLVAAAVNDYVTEPAPLAVRPLPT